jgi:sulfite reductase (NADPH) flavoprotein alpha-component
MSPARLAWAAAVLALYVLLCAAIAWQHARRRRAAQREITALQHDAGSPAGPRCCVAHASQTGQAEELALQTAQALHAAGVPVRLLPLGELDAQALARTDRLLCIASTYGEGDPPDSAAAFVRACMARDDLDLSHLHIGVLALGDSDYVQYCGFGRALDGWLQARGARPLFDRIEVDNADAAALARWQDALADLAGVPALPGWPAPALAPWRLVERHLLNPGSQGAPLHHLVLQPAHGALPDWQAGDLVQVEPPHLPGQARDYSIASVPQDGALHLVVREIRRSDGSPGRVSGWLTAAERAGDTVPLRIRAHSGFRIGDNADRPLLLIGNGSGIAGLRAHLRARIARAQAPAQASAQTPAPGQPQASAPPMWLVFGERQAATDALFAAETARWRAEGWPLREDRVYSRDGGAHRYVQHRLADAADDLRRWVDEGGAIYICGSREGMAGEVDAVLRATLGDAACTALQDSGRLRRDVY